jgi:hypothetical protein
VGAFLTISAGVGLQVYGESRADMDVYRAATGSFFVGDFAGFFSNVYSPSA